MKVTITGRHMELTPAIEDYVNKALEKVQGHFDNVLDVDVILSVEKYRQLAEFNLHANGLRINAQEESKDLYASIDAAVEKLDKQVQKHKDRIKRHKPRSSKERLEYGHQIVRLGESTGEAQETTETVGGHTVLHRETVPMTPMTVDEAAFQLQLQDDLFVVFTNAETQRINVIYARHDGTYGLIEPQY